MLEVAWKCAKTCGLPDSAVDYDPAAKATGLQRSAPDVAKINRELGSSPVVALDKGLETLREWFDFLEMR